jgi:hypothetical protein
MHTATLTRSFSGLERKAHYLSIQPHPAALYAVPYLIPFGIYKPEPRLSPSGRLWTTFRFKCRHFNSNSFLSSKALLSLLGGIMSVA